MKNPFGSSSGDVKLTLSAKGVMAPCRVSENSLNKVVPQVYITCPYIYL